MKEKITIQVEYTLEYKNKKQRKELISDLKDVPFDLRGGSQEGCYSITRGKVKVLE